MAEEKSSWERGVDALEILLQHFTVEDIEKLARLSKSNPAYAQTLRGLLTQQSE